MTGQAALFAASGERIEFEYQDGVVHGPAKIKVVLDEAEKDMIIKLSVFREVEILKSAIMLMVSSMAKQSITGRRVIRKSFYTKRESRMDLQPFLVRVGQQEKDS